MPTLPGHYSSIVMVLYMSDVVQNFEKRFQKEMVGIMALLYQLLLPKWKMMKIKFNLEEIISLNIKVSLVHIMIHPEQWSRQPNKPLQWATKSETLWS